MSEHIENLVADYQRSRVNRRDFMKRAAALGMSAPIAAGLLASVGPRMAAAQDTPVPGGQFIEGYDRDFSPMDTVRSTWADPGYNLLYEYVMLRDPQGAIVPALAESWEISADNLTWTLKIKEGLKFHSGAPCTNQEVVDNFNAFRNTGADTPEGETPDPGQNFVFWPSVTDVQPGDGNTVVVSLSKPFAAFPETLATEYSMIENLAARKAAGDQYGSATADGTGPFTLGEYSPGNQAVFNKWADYAGSNVPYLTNKGPAYLDSVKFVPILAVENRANELEAGDVHAVKNPAPQDLDRLTGNSDLVVQEWANPANLFIALNHTKTQLGFDQLDVRQAISHGIDRQAIADAVYFGHAIATQGPIASNWKWYDPGVEAFNAYDPDKAKALLAGQGWTPGSDGIVEKDGQRLSFTLLNWSAQTYGAQVNEAITDMLKDIGVEMKLQTLDTAQLFSSDGIFNTDTPADAFSYEWLWSSPMDVLVIFAVTPSPEFNGADPDLKAAFDAWQGCYDDELKAAASKAQLIWAEGLTMLPIVTGNVIWANSKKVHGWMPTQTMLYPLYNDVWIEQ